MDGQINNRWYVKNVVLEIHFVLMKLKNSSILLKLLPESTIADATLRLSEYTFFPEELCTISEEVQQNE